MSFNKCIHFQPVHSEGDQPWDFFGRNDAKAQTPVLWPPHVKTWLIGKDSDAGRDWGQEEKATTEVEMAGWHHWLDGRESQRTPGVGDGQGGLVCCDSWGRKESDMTERLNWTELRLSSLHSLQAYPLQAQHWLLGCLLANPIKIIKMTARHESASFFFFKNQDCWALRSKIIAGTANLYVHHKVGGNPLLFLPLLQSQWAKSAVNSSSPLGNSPPKSRCFMICVQISQEAGRVVWCSHFFENFPVCCDPCSQRLWHSQ